MELSGDPFARCDAAMEVGLGRWDANATPFHTCKPVTPPNLCNTARPKFWHWGFFMALCCVRAVVFP